MIENSFYLTESGSLPALIDLTDLCEDEIEEIVGRFKNDHWRFPGHLKGEVIVKFDGEVMIRHHFHKKVLWSSVG